MAYKYSGPISDRRKSSNLNYTRPGGSNFIGPLQKPTFPDPVSGINKFLNKQFGLPLPNIGNRSTTRNTFGNTSNMTKNQPNMSTINGPVYVPPPANISATSTKPTVSKPPVIDSKPAQDYINNQVNIPTVPPTTAVSGGTTPSMGQMTQPQLPRTTTGPSATDTAFAAYLKSLMPSSEVTEAKTAYNDFITSKEAGLQKISDETIPMQFITGKQRSLEDRAAIQERNLASRLGIAQDSQASAELAGKTGLDYALSREQLDMDREKLNTDKGFTLSSGQTRYDSAGNIIAGGGGGGLGTYSAGSDPTADAYVDAVLTGKMKIENIPEEYRGFVAQGLQGKKITPETSPYLKSIADNGKNAIGGLLQIAVNKPGIFGKSAAAPVPDMLRSDDFRNYKAQLDFLKGNIIPATLTAMREASKTGGALGQVSDREGAWLASSLGALDMSQSSEMIVQQLQLIDAALTRWQNAVDTYGSSGGEGEGGLYDF